MCGGVGFVKWQPYLLSHSFLLFVFLDLLALFILSFFLCHVTRTKKVIAFCFLALSLSLFLPFSFFFSSFFLSFSTRSTLFLSSVVAKKIPSFVRVEEYSLNFSYYLSLVFSFYRLGLRSRHLTWHHKRRDLCDTQISQFVLKWKKSTKREKERGIPWCFTAPSVDNSTLVSASFTFSFTSEKFTELSQVLVWSFFLQRENSQNK